MSDLLIADQEPRVHIVTFGRTVDPRRRVDVAGATPDDGARLIQWDALDVANQAFVILPRGTPEHPDEVLIVGFAGKVLDIAGADGAGTPVMMAAHAGEWTNQLWRLEPQADGSVVISSARNSDLVLDVGGADQSAGAPIGVWHRNGLVCQRYFLEVL